MFYHSLGGIYDHLAKVGASGQLFHIMTNSSEAPFRAVVASRPLTGPFQLVPYMFVSQCLMLDHFKKLQPERGKVAKTQIELRGKKFQLYSAFLSKPFPRLCAGLG